MLASTVSDKAIEAPPLASVGVQAYRAVRRAISFLDELPTLSIVIGSPLLGQFMIQYLKLFTPGQIAVIEAQAAHRQLALELGADQAIDPERLDFEQLAGAEAVFDLLGTNSSLSQSVQLVRPNGIILQLNNGSGRILFGTPIDAPAQINLPKWGSHSDLPAVLELARCGLLR
ncbi:MAG: zinc-binding dehydrogenase [Candidatus Dormibacteraceae bacterium]